MAILTKITLFVMPMKEAPRPAALPPVKPSTGPACKAYVFGTSWLQSGHRLTPHDAAGDMQTRLTDSANCMVLLLIADKNDGMNLIFFAGWDWVRGGGLSP